MDREQATPGTQRWVNLNSLSRVIKTLLCNNPQEIKTSFQDVIDDILFLFSVLQFYIFFSGVAIQHNYSIRNNQPSPTIIFFQILQSIPFRVC